jgi:tRNA(Ile)-lysidine synthase
VARSITDLAPFTDRLVGLDGLRAPVVVACSGGPDSLALLALAPRATSGRSRCTSITVCEPRARTTRASSRTWPASSASSRSVAVRVDPGPNVEARARDARYDALDRVRRELDAAVVLVGHTADDQAETVLLNLLRGSASRGLGGMAVRRDTVVRPLLGLRRSDTEAVCAALGLEPARDAMNDDTTFRRVWIRTEVLPALSAGAGRDLVPVLARQAEVLRADSDYLDELARAGVATRARSAPAGCARATAGPARACRVGGTASGSARPPPRSPEGGSASSRSRAARSAPPSSPVGAAVERHSPARPVRRG